MESKQLVVFDLDGTLNRTDLYSLPAGRAALAEFGVTQVSDEALLRCLGNRGEDYARWLLPNHSEAERSRYLERELHWEKTYLPQPGYTGSFEGIPELLTRLKAAGYRTAVCSNSQAAYICPVLEALHLTELIDEIQPLLPGMDKADTLGLLLEREQPTAAVMVGDRVFDLDAAHANHLPFIGCAYGYCPAEIESAEFVAHTPAEIWQGVQLLMGIQV